MLTALVRLNAVFNDAGLRDFPNMQARLKQYIGKIGKLYQDTNTIVPV